MLSYQILKYLTDFIIAFVAFVILAPFLLILFFIPHSIFRQKRLGKNGRSFTMFKIRTMRKVSTTSLVSDREKVTRVGHFLRATGLDEIPQVLNILGGNMSFIGPRALPVEYYNRIPERYKLRFTVRPGISGLAQVMGRNQISWHQKFRMDRFYVIHQNFALDLRILYRTVITIILAKDAYSSNAEIMKELQRFD